MTNIKQAVPFFGVANIDDSLRYYIEGLGFAMTLRWIDEGKLRWCWLERDGAALMLQEFRIPQGKVGEGVTICFICDDALAIYREATSRGLEVARPFVGNGMWVVNMSDPDGYKLSFESKTGVPEDTQFAGE